MAEDSDDKSTPTSPIMEAPSRKRSLSEMRLTSSTFASPDSPAFLFDEQLYRVQVRQIPASLSEKDLDEELHQRALDEGIELPHSIDEVEAITSSMSATTVLSERTNMQGSIMSQSTAPTSCSSSERRPATSNSIHSVTTPPTGQSRPVFPDPQKKRNSVFRSRVRRIVGKKKKGSPDTRDESFSIEVSGAQSPTDSHLGLATDLPKSSASVRSLKSSWSNQIAAPKPSYESDLDPAALKRTMECKEMQDLQKAQKAERDRFLDFRKRLLDQIIYDRDDAKGKRKILHAAAMADKCREDDRAIEELEELQLQEELKMAEEHRFWERMMNSRLRHIERRVQHPTPPPTPGRDAVSAGNDNTAKDNSPVILPVRATAGPYEYNHLAEQYREQKTLMHSHGGRINVLRGQQQRKMESFMSQKKDEVQALEQEHASELAVIDEDFNSKEKALDAILASKRALLELYWYKQALYEQQKQERSTGLKFQLLPSIILE